jgi:hypothetical protein
MDGQRSRVDEAAPVVTGRADADAADTVFSGWRQSKLFMESFNPFIELIEARGLRDTVLSRFVLKPGHLVGEFDPKHRAAKAQTELMFGLIRRGWAREFVERYLLVRIDPVSWTTLNQQAFAA